MRERMVRSLAGLMLLVGLTVPAMAGIPSQDTNQTRALTLDTAVAIALDKNPRVRAAREGVTAAKEAGGEARAPYYPDLRLTAGYTRWERHAFLPAGLTRPDIPNAIGPTDDWSTALSTRYTLFDSGQRRAELRAALARVGEAEEESAKIRQDIVLLVHRAFFRLEAAREGESVARRKLARAEDHLRLAAAKKEAGAVPQADVVRAQVDVADARLAVETAASLVRIAAGDLNTAMGLPPELPLEIDAGLPEPAPPAPPEIRDALDMAVRERPEIKAARRRVDAADATLAAARSAFGPKVRAEGAFGWRDDDFVPSDRDWMAGVSIELPIFTGFSRRHRVGRTKAELSREEAGLQALMLAVRQEVWAAHSRLQESRERVRAAEPLVRDARESVRLARERYDAGAGTMTDLLDSEAAFARADAIRVEAAWGYQTAKSAFLRAVGQLAR